MPDLPHGWRMKNSTVELVGPPLEHEGNSEDDISEPLDIKPDSEGWEDVEDDTELVRIKCLVCSEHFPAAKTMIEHCNTAHNLDFVRIQRDHELDFYESIKLVNYIRKSTSASGEAPLTNEKSAWADDAFLTPYLEDDAFLFSLDDLDNETTVEATNTSSSASP